MEPEEQRRILEAVLFAASEPVTARRLANIVPDGSTREVRETIAGLNTAYEDQGRAFRIVEVAGGYQLRTLPELAAYIRALRPTPPLRLSRAALETLAIVAYKQPLTRGEIEGVRGVDAGPVVKSLIERRLVRIAGHREVPGRPMLYATTGRFLEVFGLSSLSDLPTLREIEELLTERADIVPDLESSDDAAPSASGDGSVAVETADTDVDAAVADVDADAAEVGATVPAAPQIH